MPVGRIPIWAIEAYPSIETLNLLHVHYSNQTVRYFRLHHGVGTMSTSTLENLGSALLDYSFYQPPKNKPSIQWPHQNILRS